MDIKNKVIAITGANRGIGLAFAKACAKEGASLILVMRKEENELANELVKLGALKVRIIEADLISKDQVTNLASQLIQFPVDILFNNAGLLTGGLLEEQGLEQIYSMFQVNINALVHLSQALVPVMTTRKTGKIINHSSVSAVMHFPCATTYSASKAAVWAFSDCLHQELKGTGVSVLCLFTPGIKTRMFDEIDKLYSKNLETPKDSISPEEYALKIVNAIKNDWTYLEPVGLTGFMFRVAKHLTPLFNRVVATQFKRS